jgi:hypothetical protein
MCTFCVFFYKIVTKRFLEVGQLDEPLIIVVQIWPKPVGRYMPNCPLPKKAKQERWASNKDLLLFILFISVKDDSLYIIFLWCITVRALIYE